MKLIVSIEKDPAVRGEWFLRCNNSILCISENSHQESAEFTSEEQCNLHITSYFRRRGFWYILVWLGNLLIAPLNILLMNTDSNWYQNTVFKTINYRYKCKIPTNTHMLVKILVMNRGIEPTPQYYIEIVGIEASLVSAQDFYNPGIALWEMNKYISKVFSCMVWGTGFLYWILSYAAFVGSQILMAVLGVLFLVLFGFAVGHSIYKLRELEKS